MAFLFLGKLHVCTYICIVKLEEAIKSNKFKSELHKASLNIMYTAWYLKTLSSKELKEFGLTSEQYNVLRILNGKHPEQMCVRDIASRMIEQNSNVPRIIDRLEVKKMVKRNTSSLDKRETLITITNVGINILKLSTDRIDKIMSNHSTMDEKKAEQLNSMLEELRANLS